MTKFSAGEWTYLGERENENLDKIKDISIFSSTRAKFWPRHTRGPTPNGMYMYGSLHAPVIPFANLLGLNSYESGPQISGSVCIVVTKAHKFTPLGTFMSPNFMSFKASLDTTDTGGYSRSDSLIVIVSFQQKVTFRIITRNN